MLSKNTDDNCNDRFMSDDMRNKKRNFNQKYFVIWLRLELSEPKKLNVIWIQSWKRRYLVAGHVASDSLGSKIGLKIDDRLGYLNGRIAPDLNFVKQTIKVEKILMLGILRKHSKETLMIAKSLNESRNSIKVDDDRNLKRNQNLDYDYDRSNSIKQDQVNYIDVDQLRSDDDEDRKLMHFFVANSGYKNLKDPLLYTSEDFNVKTYSSHSINCSTLMSRSECFCPRIDQRSTPTKLIHQSDLEFIENKENYCPIVNKQWTLKTFDKNHLMDHHTIDNYQVIRENYPKIKPDNFVECRIDPNVKARRALRNLNILN
ncbi:mannose-1-phosphate guanyltransferase beta-like [Sarcoptes scabiei]|nr:mannose-1-phosphate guanyltransferase beta-like [Sarcoptes scabiei]